MSAVPEIETNDQVHKLTPGHGERPAHSPSEGPGNDELVEEMSHLVVGVTDLDRSEAWYRDVIGLDVVGRNLTAEERPHCVLRLNSGQLFILVENDSVVPRRPGSQAVHHAFVLTPNQYRRARERLLAHGLPVEDMRAGRRALGEYCMDAFDPDGHHFQIEYNGPEAYEVRAGGAGIVDCGAANRYRLGEVVLFSRGNFHLVRLREGFIAMSRWCTHMNGLVAWQGAHWRFRCPFHNTTYDRRGNPMGKHDVEALRLHPVTFSPDGHVLVNTEEVVRRAAFDPEQAARVAPAESRTVGRDSLGEPRKKGS